ncbi:MAG TPA: protein phosphatase 2C domain-containing protein [Polyangia bacterium]|jgi:protein phosphatase
MVAPNPPEHALEAAALTDTGTARDHNEDACAVLCDSPTCAVVGVADGVSSYPGGETASRLALDVLVRAWGEQPGVSPYKRLARAAQQANIEVHDLAMVVPELNGMATTLTAVVLDRGELVAAHVGDSRLYLVREDGITQLTKDHTVIGERVRMGLLSEERGRGHPHRSVLTRCLGRELIVAIDRITRPVQQADALLVCSDGLYGVLEDGEMAALVRQAADAAGACRALLDAANARGTPDNLTAVVVRVVGPVPERAPENLGWRRLFRGR